MLPHVRLLVSTFALLVVSLRAEAQIPDELLNKMASAAARAGGVKIFCSDFYVVDRIELEKIGDTLNLDGSRRFGADLFFRKYYEFLSNHGAEVAKTGAALWCPKQRDLYRRNGITGLIGGPIQ